MSSRGSRRISLRLWRFCALQAWRFSGHPFGNRPGRARVTYSRRLRAHTIRAGSGGEGSEQWCTGNEDLTRFATPLLRDKIKQENASSQDQVRSAPSSVGVGYGYARGICPQIAADMEQELVATRFRGALIGVR